MKDPSLWKQGRTNRIFDAAFLWPDGIDLVEIDICAIASVLHEIVCTHFVVRRWLTRPDRASSGPGKPESLWKYRLYNAMTNV